AVDIELLLVEPELADAGDDLGAERLVDLDAVDLVETEAGPFQERADRRRGADAHDLRRTADGEGPDQPGERRLALSLEEGAAGDDDPGGAVDHAGGIAPRLHAAEGRTELGERLARGRAGMGVLAEAFDLAVERDRAGLTARAIESLRRNGDDLVLEKA